MVWLSSRKADLSSSDWERERHSWNANSLLSGWYHVMFQAGGMPIREILREMDAAIIAAKYFKSHNVHFHPRNFKTCRAQYHFAKDFCYLSVLRFWVKYSTVHCHRHLKHSDVMKYAICFGKKSEQCCTYCLEISNAWPCFTFSSLTALASYPLENKLSASLHVFLWTGTWKWSRKSISQHITYNCVLFDNILFFDCL